MQRFQFSLPDGKLSVGFFGPESPSGDRPVLHWAHANGFNGQTYAPLLAPLAEAFDIFAWDARGHGFTDAPAEPTAMTGWHLYANDLEPLIAHLADKAGQKIWLGGHSMGGCTSVLLAARRPDLVAGLVLADPVITPRIRWWMHLVAKLVGRPGSQLVEMAKKRRAAWPDRAAVRNSYAGRGAFRTWQDGFLDAYLDGGLKENGDGVGLACAPAWEAANFKGPQLDCAKHIKKLSVPFTLLVAETGSTTFFRKPFETRPVDKKIETIAGSSHFLPMEFPDLVRSEITARLSAG